MRAFDNWNSYLNNDRNLLHGKVRFCRKGTTDNIVIYNRDGIAIRNPEFTDLLGRTEYQVFVENADNVTAYFYEYVGTGDMMGWPEEDYDPSRWAYQYSSDNMDPVQAVDIEATSAEGVATMADLRARDPEDVPELGGVKMLWLYGYYNSGDTSPVLYVWDDTTVKSDNGGSVIMPNNVSGPGRWILASREYIFDVRHFGIFPVDNKYSVDFSYTSQLANCAAYLVNEGLNAWFPDFPNGIGYYLLDGTNTFAIEGDIYCSDAVRFMCKTGTSGTAIQCHELHKAAPYLFDSTVQTGSATLTCDYINISWLGGNCQGNARVGWVIDAPSYPRVITGKEVHFVTNGNGALQLDNCVITSNKKITGAITISNSVLRTDFFADNYDWADLTSINNTILLENCKDATTYVTLKNKQYEADYGDINEGTITGMTLLSGAIVENASFSNVTLRGNCELHNVSGTVSVSGSDLVLNAVDCWLTFSNSFVCTTLALRRGSIGGTGIQVLTSLHVENADIYAPLTTLGALAYISGCNVNATVIATNITLKDNVISSTVSQRDVNGVVNVDCDGNTFNVGGYHNISATTANAVVNGHWVGNIGLGSTMPILLDRTNLNDSEAAHNYVYEGNTGKFLGKKEARGSYPFQNPTLDLTKFSIDLSTGYISFQGDMGADGHTDISKYCLEFEMFTVGTSDIGTLFFRWVPRPYYDGTPQRPPVKGSLYWGCIGCPVCEIERTTQEWQSEQVGTPWAKGLSFVNNYTWRITRAVNVLRISTVQPDIVLSRTQGLPANYYIGMA